MRMASNDEIHPEVGEPLGQLELAVVDLQAVFGAPVRYDDHKIGGLARKLDLPLHQLPLVGADIAHLGRGRQAQAIGVLGHRNPPKGNAVALGEDRMLHRRLCTPGAEHVDSQPLPEIEGGRQSRLPHVKHVVVRHTDHVKADLRHMPPHRLGRVEHRIPGKRVEPFGNNRLLIDEGQVGVGNKRGNMLVNRAEIKAVSSRVLGRLPVDAIMDQVVSHRAQPHHHVGRRRRLLRGGGGSGTCGRGGFPSLLRRQKAGGRRKNSKGSAAEHQNQHCKFDGILSHNTPPAEYRGPSPAAFVLGFPPISDRLTSTSSSGNKGPCRQRRPPSAAGRRDSRTAIQAPAYSGSSSRKARR